MSCLNNMNLSVEYISANLSNYRPFFRLIVGHSPTLPVSTNKSDSFSYIDIRR